MRCHLATTACDPYDLGLRLLVDEEGDMSRRRISLRTVGATLVLRSGEGRTAAVAPTDPCPPNRRQPVLSVLIGTIALLFLSQSAFASPILTSSFETQLEGWLGSGDLVFTNIYTKATGDTTIDFHAAVDGRGATFTLFEALYEGNTFVLGGYNPQSWSSIGDFNLTPTDAERTAFIYNLSTGVAQRQRLTSDPFDPDAGQFQTYNDGSFGPTFGAGTDLWVDAGQGSNLSTGGAFQGSYGTGGPCAYGSTSVLGVSQFTTPCLSFTGIPFEFSVGALEVYTVAPATVPEPSTLLLLGTGAASLFVRRRRNPSR